MYLLESNVKMSLHFHLSMTVNLTKIIFSNMGFLRSIELKGMESRVNYLCDMDFIGVELQEYKCLSFKVRVTL